MDRYQPEQITITITAGQGRKVAFSLPENFRTAMGLIREKEILCTYDQTKI